MANIIDFDTAAATVAGKDAQAALVKYLSNEGKGLVPVVRQMTAAYTADHAEKLLASVNVSIAKARSKATNTIVQPATITPQRLAATRGLFKASEWKSWPQFLSNVEPIDPAWDTLINLCNWFRKGIGIAKDDATAAPSLDAALAKLAEAKEKRETTKTAAERVGARPAKTLKSMVDDLTALQTIETNKKAKGFLTAALKSLESYAPYVAAREEEAELAKVKAKHAKKKAEAHKSGK